MWHPRGRLIDIAGESGTFKLGIARSALICDVLNEAGWGFRRCRDRSMQELISLVEAHPLPVNRQVQDDVLWRKNDADFCKHFSTSETWHRIHTHNPPQDWSKVVWFSFGVPRFAFITWLAVKNRLSTGARMRAWGQTQGCLFCGEPFESRDHLFFACLFTYMLWIETVGTLLGRPPDPDWETTLQYLTTHSFGYLNYILLRLVFQTTIYMIWRVHNDRKPLKKPTWSTGQDHRQNCEK
ncbi:uncharacterized protein LOC108830703 [Raphanus sativus]|uniref:Uncharacterized protein LOC108830703 n=1 Tax=Raphanus sativus TaxID=3726 RepID=A0A6J0LJG6_RAPSA|nr:uncharacterized protein LOC108830703 [Raphanus sativus]